jgi:hypothetical protein
MPDGSVRRVAIDFSVHQRLGALARRDYGMGGTVQHGASTLPPEAFDRFPEVETLEVHLATGFQNLVYEHLPAEFKDRLYDWVRQNCAADRRADETDAQFVYRNRKRVFGPFKRRFWDLPATVRIEVAAALEAEFELLFTKLRAAGTRGLAERYAPPTEVGAVSSGG